MPSNEDILRSAPPASFNGALDKFRHSLSPDRPRSTTASPLKRRYADPEGEDEHEAEAHTPSRPPAKRTRSSPSPSPSPINLLRDTTPPNLILLLVGVNPGLLTGRTGFVYAHPSNLYWKLLHGSGLTSRRHPPRDTYRLPALYGLGNTNLVARPTRDASMLSRAELAAGARALEHTVRACRPDAVALVGKGVWDAVWRVRRDRGVRRGDGFAYGWQAESENVGVDERAGWPGAPVFVATSTSGLAAGMSMAEKLAVWSELGAWVVRRREERGFVPDES
ncbi:uracil DNA N-glycosylase Thp1 [Ophidiomyces ophidiicola]|nr:uracil DNA N-glycosylase Thp1 [Ophidiomyces ophidiicola]